MRNLLYCKYKTYILNAVKFLNFRTLENFAVRILKQEKRGFTIELMHPKDADSIANS